MSTLASVITRDVFANRPSAGIAGRLFYASDTGVLYRDNGSSWDSYSATAAAGGVSAQNVVTGSRALATTYHNTGSSAMFVLVTAHTSTTGGNILAQTDASTPPTTYVGYQYLSGTSVDSSLGFWVLPGNYYKVTVNVGSPTLTLWTEWS